MKKLVLTVLAIMACTPSTHTISPGAIATLTFIPIAIVTGIIIHKNNKKKHKREENGSSQAQKAMLQDLKEYKNEKKRHKLQLRRLESHKKTVEHRSKIQDLDLEIGDLEDRIEALN
ncbi:MAG: hypothetical protein NTZ68_01490 [Candidatus Dependentiae bacterium]|nr:hypothetical protein [Candidatus Dependentiae bacterium]